VPDVAELEDDTEPEMYGVGSRERETEMGGQEGDWWESGKE
jgi:hypothetical protein